MKIVELFKLKIEKLLVSWFSKVIKGKVKIEKREKNTSLIS